MGHLLRSLAVIAVLATGAAPLAAFEGPAPSAGGSKKAPAKGSSTADKSKGEGEKKDDKAASTAQRMLGTGVSAFEAGKTEQAIRAFDTVISGGALNSRQMARALYYRGLSYRKKGSPARAIADLSAATWIKDGLTASEQQEAISNRAAAYRDAGIANVPAAQPTAAAGGSFGADAWQTASTPQTASATPKSAAPAPATSAPASAPQTATYVPARPPPPPPQTSGSSSSGGIGGFFNSLFGGGSSNSEVTTASIHEQPAPATSVWIQTTTPSPSQPAPPASQTAAAPAPPPPPPPTARVQRPEPQAAPQAANNAVPFKTETQVTAVAPPVVAPPKKTTAASGKYHVQVAAVRSRNEAYALSVRLLSQHASELGSRRPQVEQKVMGSMGVFYRVSVGPYASAEESQQLCGSLRASGFDCLIITQ